MSSYPVSTIEGISKEVFWGRISLGMKGFVEGPQVWLWLSLALLMLICSIQTYIKPRMQRLLGPLIMALSFSGIPIGGGFIVGTILGFAGGASAMEWPKTFKETFIGKLLRAAKLDSKFYKTIADDIDQMKTAVYSLMFISLLSGIGNALYIYNLNKIKQTEATLILLEGVIFSDSTIFVTAIGYIGIGIIKWLILAFCIYLVGIKLMGYPSDFDKIARALAYAYTPLALQIFLPLMFCNEPYVSLHWPIGLLFITKFWMFLAAVAAVKGSLDSTRKKAIGAVILGGTIYWIVTNLFILPKLKLPGIYFEFALPESLTSVAALIGVALILATLLGVFSRKE